MKHDQAPRLTYVPTTPFPRHAKIHYSRSRNSASQSGMRRKFMSLSACRRRTKVKNGRMNELNVIF